MSVHAFADLDACDNCGASRWEPGVRVDGGPFCRCAECGRRIGMPPALERRLRERGWVPKVPIRRPAA